MATKGCTPDNFISQNCLRLSFTNIQRLWLKFVGYESTIESSSNILALCETNLYDSIDSTNFSVKVYLHLIGKDSVIYMHGLAVYVKEGLPFV